MDCWLHGNEEEGRAEAQRFLQVWEELTGDRPTTPHGDTEDKHCRNIQRTEYEESASQGDDGTTTSEEQAVARILEYLRQVQESTPEIQASRELYAATSGNTIPVLEGQEDPWYQEVEVATHLPADLEGSHEPECIDERDDLRLHTLHPQHQEVHWSSCVKDTCHAHVQEKGYWWCFPTRTTGETYPTVRTTQDLEGWVVEGWNGTALGLVRTPAEDLGRGYQGVTILRKCGMNVGSWKQCGNAGCEEHEAWKHLAMHYWIGRQTTPHERTPTVAEPRGEDCFWKHEQEDTIASYTETVQNWEVVIGSQGDLQDLVYYGGSGLPRLRCDTKHPSRWNKQERCQEHATRIWKQMPRSMRTSTELLRLYCVWQRREQFDEDLQSLSKN